MSSYVGRRLSPATDFIVLLQPARSPRREKRGRAAGGGCSGPAFSAAVGISSRPPRRRRNSGHRKAARSDNPEVVGMAALRRRGRMQQSRHLRSGQKMQAGTVRRRIFWAPQGGSSPSPTIISGGCNGFQLHPPVFYLSLPFQ